MKKSSNKVILSKNCLGIDMARMDSQNQVKKEVSYETFG